jgi:glycosyltransferase involved in cell wall biosynthesis
MDVAIVIPAYMPDNTTLQTYTDQITESICPDTVRIELDAAQENPELDFTHSVTVNSVKNRRGKGKAITDGFNSVSADILCFVDGDGSVPINSINRVIDSIKSKTCDIAIGSRRLPGSIIHSHQTIVRRLMGKVLVRTANVTLSNSLSDYQCGVKCITQEAWKEISSHCAEEGFAWDLEFLTIADILGYEITEIPIEWEDHPDSTVNPVYAPINFMKALLRVKMYSNRIQDE